jgi:hypothetical protein
MPPSETLPGPCARHQAINAAYSRAARTKCWMPEIGGSVRKLSPP